MVARQKTVLDRTLVYMVTLTCKCVVRYHNSPPSVNDTVTCTRHGEAVVTHKQREK